MGEAREVLDRLNDIMFSGDLEGVKQLYSSDAVGVAPDGTEYKGGHEIVEWLGMFFQAFPDARYEHIAKHETGKFAIDEGRFTGTHSQPMTMPDGRSIEATGKRVSVRGCDVVTVERGKITEHHFYFDSMSMMSQLGLMPEE